MTRINTNQAASVAGKNGFSLISDAKFRELYAVLLQCSMLDEQLGRTAGYKRWTGREAGTAGVVACLRSGDSVTTTPNGVLARHLHHHQSALTPQSTPLAHLAAATGQALRHKLEKNRSIAVVFTGAGEPDRMREIFAAAAKQSLPVVYALEDNDSLAEVSGNIPVIRVDGSDTVAVYRVAHESVFRAREGGGPTIIACAEWPGDSERDPLAKLEQYLSRKNLFRARWKQALEKKYARTLDAAVKTVP